MNIKAQIKNYIEQLPDAKRVEMEALHQRFLQAMPTSKLWYFDGTDESGKIVSNPQIGYGLQTLKYTDGKTKAFYQVGISANTTGISVYIMGLDDKNYLPVKYSDKIGKANVTGYCIKFKKLKDVDMDMLEEAILDGVKQTS